MSLFQFGFTHTRSQNTEGEVSTNGPSHMPSFESSGLGRAEYEECISQVAELADPNPSKKRRQRGSYSTYTPSDRARIGKYALENGNKSARLRFLKQLILKRESEFSEKFLKAYSEQLQKQKSQLNPQPATEICCQP